VASKGDIMQTPQLIVRVDGNDLIVTEVRPGRDDHENRYPLDNLNMYGLDQARTMIGRTVLALLESFYPDEFELRPYLKLEKDYEHEMNIVGSLIAKSLSGRTRRYAPAIESLIQEIVTASPALASHVKIAHWPMLKEQIGLFSD
jgi:hypothetical protein